MVERKSWIDICKGLAIILVVIGHVGDAFDGELQFIYTFIYFFHMPLFMFVGGYLGCTSKKPFGKKYCEKKIVAYGVPYIVFSIVYWSFKFIGNTVVNNPISIADLFLIVVYPLSFMWYIYALLIISLFVELLRACFRRYKAIILVVSILCYIIGLVLRYHPAYCESYYVNLIIVDVMINIIWYAMGYVIGDKIIEGIERFAKKRWCAGIVLFVLYSYMLFIANTKLAGEVALYVVWAMIGIVATCILAMIISKNKVLEYLGKNTLPVYVLHGIVTSVMQLVLEKMGVVTDVLLLLVCTLLGLIIPLLGYEICRRIWWIDFCFYPTKYLGYKRK